MKRLTTEQKAAAISGIASEVSAFLTILAALPYELGDAGALLPPGAKSWIAGIGVFATLGLRLLKRYLEIRADKKAPTR